MSCRPPPRSQAAWRARADRAAACSNARRTVSVIPEVLSSFCAAAKRSSSKSIRRFVNAIPPPTEYTICPHSIYARSCAAESFAAATAAATPPSSTRSIGYGTPKPERRGGERERPSASCRLRPYWGDGGLTTVPPNLADVLPEGVQLMRVQDSPQGRRRALAARMPGRPSSSVAAVIAALRSHYAR